MQGTNVVLKRLKHFLRGTELGLPALEDRSPAEETRNIGEDALAVEEPDVAIGLIGTIIVCNGSIEYLVSRWRRVELLVRCLATCDLEQGRAESKQIRPDIVGRPQIPRQEVSGHFPSESRLSQTG